MSKEQELSNAIDVYLDKSIMPLPEGHPMRPDRGYKPMDLKDTLRQVGEAIGVVKPKVPSTIKEGKPENRHGVPVIRGGPHDVTHEYQRGGAKDFRKPGGLNKAKPKVLKPGTPEHDRAMAEMEAAKEAKRPKNPAGETASPSSPSSRTRFGDRPLVGGLDKADGLGQKDDYFKYGTREARGDQFGRKADFQTLGGQQGGGVKLTSEEKAGEVYAKDPKLVKKSMDLEEGSRSWAYQG